MYVFIYISIYSYKSTFSHIIIPKAMAAVVIHRKKRPQPEIGTVQLYLSSDNCKKRLRLCACGKLNHFFLFSYD